MELRRVVVFCAVGALGYGVIQLLPRPKWRERAPARLKWLTGTVRVQPSERPLGLVWIVTRAGIAVTDSAGGFAVRVDSLPDTVLAQARGYRPTSAAVAFRRGTPMPVSFRLERTATQPSPLDGRWQATFRWLRAPTYYAIPKSRVVTGTIVFADTIPAPYPPGPREREGWLYGWTDLDFTPFFGGPIAPFRGSRSIFGGVSSRILQEVVADIFSPDSVWIDLAPRITHGPVSLRGAIRGDSILAVWTDREICIRGKGCEATGPVILRRAR